jgi:hypothetical protein
VRSDWPLPCIRCDHGSADIDLARATAAQWRDIRRLAALGDSQQWFENKRLEDGSTFLRWLGRYEFLVAHDGRRILAESPARGALESFLVYLLNGALPVAMLYRGLDPLHATAVAVDGAAVAFLGRSGYGKSTLGAAFLQDGSPILTDDLLIVKQERDQWLAYPGPPRLKLLPKPAKMFFGKRASGVPMNPETSKLVIPLETPQAMPEAVPLRVLYVLNPPRSRDMEGAARVRAGNSSAIRLRRLQGRQALLALVRNSYNDWLAEPARLSRQIAEYARLASQVPVIRLSYPRRMASLEAVRKAVLADLRALSSSIPASAVRANLRDE